MSNPAPSPVLRAIEKLRRLSALALWFAALFGRILPGAARRAEQAEAWRYVESTMTQLADLLERLAAGEIPPERPKRATSRPRPESAGTRPASRRKGGIRARKPARVRLRLRRASANDSPPPQVRSPPALRNEAAKPKIPKLRPSPYGQRTPISFRYQNN